MVGHSPIPRFDSTFCGETIVSKTAQESGYLFELSGTAVHLLMENRNGLIVDHELSSLPERFNYAWYHIYFEIFGLAIVRTNSLTLHGGRAAIEFSALNDKGGK
jgi:hypothetical protein